MHFSEAKFINIYFKQEIVSSKVARVAGVELTVWIDLK